MAVLLSLPTYSQCFSSSGNPVGGSQNMGTLEKKVLSCIVFYRSSFSDRYFEGSSLSDVSILKNANYNYSGTLLAYGITRGFTLEMEAGYFINKTKNYNIPAGYSLKGFGPANVLLSGKFQLINSIEKGFGWSASVGLKAPFKGELQYVDNVRLPFDLQPSTGAFGVAIQSYMMKQNSFTGMRYFLFNRVDLNGRSRDGYHYGAAFVNALFVSKHLIKTSSWPVSITLIMQVRNEVHRQNAIWDEPEISSGAVKLFASPQVNFSFHETWNLSILSDIPIYQYYNHIQLANRIAFGLSLSRAFPFY
jgi:hypothetical protein